MNNTNTGGPAFPYPFYDEKGHCIDGIEGMTLRDYFAAKAMQVFLQNPETDFREDAESAYLMAHHMLKVKNQNDNP
jgi:hypothetical protein